MRIGVWAAFCAGDVPKKNWRPHLCQAFGLTRGHSSHWTVGNRCSLSMVVHPYSDEYSSIGPRLRWLHIALQRMRDLVCLTSTTIKVRSRSPLEMPRETSHISVGRQVIVADISWTWWDTSTANWWTRRARAEEHDLRRVA